MPGINKKPAVEIPGPSRGPIKTTEEFLASRDDGFDVFLSRNSELEILRLHYSLMKQDLPRGTPLRIQVRYQLTNQTVLTWETTYADQTLYIEVPHGCLPDASKDAFVALLEYAEEVLNCDRAIIFFAKERNERATLVRTFMFMGFFAVPPESPLLHFHDPKNVYLVYEIR